MRALTILGAAALALWGCVDKSEITGDAAAADAAGRDAVLDYAPLLDGLPRGDSACAYFSTEARQKPLALMIVLDRSSSMSTNKKWAAAQKAIIKAIDKAAFDNLDLGLMAYPAYPVPAPKCLLFVAKVSCGVNAIAQVPLNDTGTDKSSATKGPRSQIYGWLSTNGPDTTGTDASPGYDALDAAIDALQAHTLGSPGHRALLLITDGGFSCASVSSPKRPGYSDGLCPDWEYPDTVIKRIKEARGHSTRPVSSFIVGVPGSDSTGKPQGPYATAPYHMRLALSAYAHAGSPGTVPPTCTGKSFTKSGGDPKVPCHFDMTQGTFDADALAKVIGDIRGAVLGCTFQLPEVDDKNKVINKAKVNVQVTIDGGSPVMLPRRSDKQDSCAKVACWDYDQDDNVQLLGKACEDVKNAKSARVEIVVGCLTVLK